jgi:hypothetical protein
LALRSRAVMTMTGMSCQPASFCKAIVVSVLLLSMKIFAPLGRQLERGRKRLFDRGIWVGNRGNLLVVTSVTAIRDLLS